MDEALQDASPPGAPPFEPPQPTELPSDRVHLAASPGCLAIAYSARLVMERPNVNGVIAWTLAMTVFLFALGAVGFVVHAVVRRIVPHARRWTRSPKEALAKSWGGLISAPGITSVRWLLDLGMVASLLAVALLPVTYSAHLAAAVPSPTPPSSSPALEFARHLPLPALTTYLAGFWTAWLLTGVDLHRALRWYRTTTRRRPAAAAILSYAAVGLVGAWLLSLPFLQRDMLGASLLTSLFVSFSALTTTGLSNVEIVAQWNALGHLVILAMTLVGGLGIFMLWALISSAARNLAHLPGAPLGGHELQDPSLQRYFRRAGLFFFSSIGLGAVALFLADGRSSSLGDRLLRAVFHAGSAFCNAGFTLGSSVQSFGGSYLYGAIMCVLVVLGGLGPAVMVFPRSLHARAALILSGVLVSVGALLFYLLDLRNPSNNIVLSLYQSIAARTAGFGWVDFGRIGDAAMLWLMVLMFIGACPGGTGGGIKVTVLYTLRRAFLALGQGLPEDDRRVRESALESMEAFAAAGFFGSIIVIGTLLLVALEPQPVLSLLFEVVSAVSTTGLSKNLTPSLSPMSLMVLVFLMVAGKIGPLLALHALFRSRLDSDDFLERIESGRVLTV